MINLRASFADKLEGKYSIFISFPYSKQIIDIIKTMPQYRWNAQTKEWEVSYDYYDKLIGTLNYYNIPYNGQRFLKSIEELTKIIENMQALKQQDKDIDVSNLDKVEFKTKPFNYQLEGIAYGLQVDNYLLADEPGLGKTLQTANTAILKRGGKHCLIIVGFDSLQFNWKVEIEKHTNEKARVLGQRLIGNNKYITGSIKERFEDLLNIDDIEEFFIITALTTIRQCNKEEYIDKNGKKRKNKIYYIADKIEELCRQGKIGRIILDESQKAKNYDTDNAQSLLRLKSATYKVAATGTPIMNENIDLYPIMYWLGYETNNFWQFREKYCKLGGYKGKDIVGQKNTPELHQRLSQFMLRRKKDEVLELPEKIYIDELLEIDGKQYQLYTKMQRQQRALLKQIKGNKVELLAATLALRKITCHPAWYDIEYSKADSVKYNRCLQLVSEAVANNQKTIIFSSFTTPFDSSVEGLNLLNLLKPYNPAMIIGKTKDRITEVEKFQNDEDCYVIVGSIGAMGTGLTLNAASNVIFLDESWNKATKDQCCDRAHRVGTKHVVNIYTLMCKNTVDEHIHDVVYKKGRLADEIVDGVTTEELEQILSSDF